MQEARLAREPGFSLHRPIARLDVPSLAAPDIKKSGAVKLFVERAAAACPDFALSSGNEQPVAELCRRLDGLPLALELGPPACGSLSLVGLLDRIGTRLDLGAGGAADLPEGQRALRGRMS